MSRCFVLGGVFAALLCAVSVTFPATAQQSGNSPIQLKKRLVEQVVPQAALRGIEKKDIRRGMVIAKSHVRLVFLYDADQTPDAVAQALARITTPNDIVRILPEFVSQTPPDTARQLPDMGLSSISGLTFVAAKQNAECDQPGCVKSEYGCFCYRLLDIDKVTLSEFPIDDPEFTPRPLKPKGSPTGGTEGTGGRLAAATKTVVIVVSESLQTKLMDPNWWKRNHAWFEKNVLARISASPDSTNLTIKTKSSPP